MPGKGANTPHRRLSAYLIALCVCATVWLPTAVPAEEAVLRIAVLAHRGIDRAIDQWGPTAEYLSETISGSRFDIIPVSNDDIGDVVDSGEVDFVLTNPASYAGLEYRYGVTRFATLRKGRKGGGSTQFGAVIITGADRTDIRRLPHLAGKSFMAVHENAFGGWWMARKVLKDAGLESSDLGRLAFVGFPQDQIVLAVRDGDVDAGTVRAETLAGMIAKGRIQADEVRLLNPIETPGYPVPHSTRAYPEWPMAALPGTPRQQVEKVLVALLGLPFDHAAAEAAGISGWTVPLNYQPVHELMQSLKVGPYAVSAQLKTWDVVKAFWPWIAAFVVPALLLLALSMARMNREVTGHRNYLHDTLLSIGDAVVTLDDNGRVDFLNGAAKAMCCGQDRPPVSKEFDQLFRLSDALDGRPISLAPQVLPASAGLRSRTAVLTVADGETCDVKLTVTAVHNGHGGTRGWVVIMHDISQIQELTRRLTHQASHDELTGLVNRREFARRLQRAVTSACRGDHRHVLCFLDLDQFKIVNDTSGHEAGDQLLKQLSSLLKANLRAHDTVARLGGDEFGVLMEDCDLDTGAIIAEKLRDAVERHRFEWEGRIFETGVSIGVVPVDHRSSGVTDLMSTVDTACFAAKEQGRNRVQIYRPGDRLLAGEHKAMNWAQRIAQGLDAGEFVLFLQPIEALCAEGAGRKAEVLIRMRGPDGDNISPGVFLPAAERFNLMPKLDRWVLRHALPQIKRIRAADPKATFSINLSGQTLDDPRFADFVLKQLEVSGVSADSLCFEITETAAIANLNLALDFMGRMRAEGCSFALDDFGSGLSSFTYLKELPVDFLKIDGGLIKHVADDPVTRAMVASIQEIAGTMGIDTIAEFVSSEAIRRALKDIGVGYVQGYAIGRPRDMAATSEG